MGRSCAESPALERHQLAWFGPKSKITMDHYWVAMTAAAGQPVLDDLRNRRRWPSSSSLISNRNHETSC